jgi:uncharacterized protein (TIGR03435 family)
MPTTRLMRLIAVLVTLSGAMAFGQGQNITGQWQGTLNAGRELRTVVMISNADGGGLRALFYSIDQSTQAINAVTTLQGTTVRFSIAPLNVNYEGTLSADGKTIAGTFTQNGKPLPLTLTRTTPETAWALPQPPKPMATDKPAAFEVATVKPSVPDRPGKLFTVKGRQVITINTTTNDLITFAYGIHAKQIIGGANWMESDKYDVTGQPEGDGLPNTNQLREMIQKLLTDRFKLTFHRDKRELPAYAVLVGPTGSKITKNESNPNGLPGLFFKGLGVMVVTNATMADFAGTMQGAVLDRPVVDRTGLSGRFDFTLQWTPDESQFAGMGVRVPPPSPDAQLPTLFTAMQEQLGLRLDSTRAPVEVFVIDKVERPSEN